MTSHENQESIVDSFNYAFKQERFQFPKDSELHLLYPKKDKNLEFLKNWRPITLLNTDYKIATKAIAMGLARENITKDFSPFSSVRLAIYTALLDRLAVVNRHMIVRIGWILSVP